jgi:hypothetical protein
VLKGSVNEREQANIIIACSLKRNYLKIVSSNPDSEPD